MNVSVWLVFALHLTITHQSSLTDEQQSKLVALHKKCQSDTNADSNLLKNIKSGEFPEDEKVEEYFGCMFKAIGLLNESGEFQKDVALSKMPKDIKPEDAAKVFEACKDTKGETAGKTAYMLYQCYYKISPSHITFGL